MKDLFLFRYFKKSRNDLKIEYLENLVSKNFKIMFNLFHEDKYELKMKYNIHLIHVKYDEKSDTFFINITLLRPGLFIGKAGNNFDNIRNKCLPICIGELKDNNCFSKIEIKLIEFDPFDYLKTENKIIKNYENSQSN